MQGVNCLICHRHLPSIFSRYCKAHDKPYKAPRHCVICGKVMTLGPKEHQATTCKGACRDERNRQLWREKAKANRVDAKAEMPQSDAIVKSIFRKAREINRQLEDDEYEKRFA